MLDLVSTRGVDPETRGCAQLLAAVIADAVKSACSPPSDREKKLGRNIDTAEADPDASMRFLFEARSPFSLYASYIGLNAQALRSALLGNRQAGPTSEKLFTGMDSRIFRQRYRWWREAA